VTAPEEPIVVSASPPSPAADAASPPHVSRYLLAIGLVVMLAGLLFGDDQGVISGALSGIDKSFHPSTLVIEIITSWVTLGAMAGALVAGTLTEHYGRRTSILPAAAVFVVGALLEALAPDTFVLAVGRLVLGAGVGDASAEATQLEEAMQADAQATWREVFARDWQKPLSVAALLAILQQLTGINAIIYTPTRSSLRPVSTIRPVRASPRSGPSAPSTWWPRWSPSSGSTTSVASRYCSSVRRECAPDCSLWPELSSSCRR